MTSSWSAERAPFLPSRPPLIVPALLWLTTVYTAGWRSGPSYPPISMMLTGVLSEDKSIRDLHQMQFSVARAAHPSSTGDPPGWGGLPSCCEWRKYGDLQSVHFVQVVASRPLPEMSCARQHGADRALKQLSFEGLFDGMTCVMRQALERIGGTMIINREAGA